MRRMILPWMVVGILGCGELRSPTEPIDGGPPPVDPSATFTRVQNEIFATSCAFAGCHGAAGTQAGLNLTPGVAYGNLVDVASTQIPQIARVDPRNPDQSYLFMKVTGAGGIVGSRMPLGQPELSEAQKDLIRNWILRGAPND